MRRGFSHCVLASLFSFVAAGCGPSASATPDDAGTTVAHPTQDPGPPEMEAPEGLDFYYVVMLRRGPKWTAAENAETLALAEGHMNYIRESAATGTLRIAGPFLGQTESTDYAGIYIYNTTSLEETKTAVARDPAVAAGRFVPEYLLWMAPSGLQTAQPDGADAPVKDDQPSPQCQGPEHRAFDFWLGRWVVESGSGQFAGRNHIERAHGGCAVLEHWASANGGSGTSTNYYDPKKKRWVQNWIDATGTVIQLEGGMEGNSMVLLGTFVQADGSVQDMRGTWTPLDDGRVRQFFETSKDGKTWNPSFEGFYRPVTAAD